MIESNSSFYAHFHFLEHLKPVFHQYFELYNLLYLRPQKFDFHLVYFHQIQQSLSFVIN